MVASFMLAFMGSFLFAVFPYFSVAIFFSIYYRYRNGDAASGY